MKRVLVLGVGRIGTAITRLCQEYTSGIELHAADIREPKISVPFTHVDLSDAYSLISLSALLDKVKPDAVINCLPHDFNQSVIEAAAIRGIDYFDLSEDVESSKFAQHVSANLELTIMPMCGLAPGLINTVAGQLLRSRDHLECSVLDMRVGALPRSPDNYCGYKIGWSVDGLVNEYLKPASLVRGGELIEKPSLEELETCRIGERTFEAFLTSGGMGTMGELRHRVKHISYKTVRYPGHRDCMKFLFDDLYLRGNPEMLKKLLSRLGPPSSDEVVLYAEGTFKHSDAGGWFRREATKFIEPKRGFSAIQVATATPVVAALDMWSSGRIGKGFIHQHEVSYEDMSQTRVFRDMIGEVKFSVTI